MEDIYINPAEEVVLLTDIKLKHWFYVPNLLSLMRLMLLVPIFLLLAHPGKSSNVYLLIVIGIAIISDWLDGFFARKLNQKSDLGRILDPLADKVIIVVGLAGFVIYRDFPLALVISLAYRDVIIALGGIVATRKTGQIAESNIYGKTNTFIFSLAGFAFLINPDWFSTLFFLACSYISVVVSGLSYIFAAARLFDKSDIYKSIASILFVLPILILMYFMRNSLFYMN